MGITANMKAFRLQNKTKIGTESGAQKETWSDGPMVDVSIYQKNERLITQSARYNESTHTGLSFSKNIKAFKNRLRDEETQEIFEITSAVNDGRLTNLLLKKVDTDV
jgi:hypothetical protein